MSMSVTQNEHGVFIVRKKVPKKLEEAAAVVTAASKPRVAFLQRSLRTKDKREAQRLAPPVLMEFERVLAEAEALLMERPLRSELDPREIERIASFFYVSELATDEEGRREGGAEASFQNVACQLDEAGIEYQLPTHSGRCQSSACQTVRWPKSTNLWKWSYPLLNRRWREATSLS